MSDDIDSDYAEFDFAPAVSNSGAEPDGTASATGSATPGRSAGSRFDRVRGKSVRRRIGASAVLLFALAGMGGAYAAFAPTSGAADSGASASDIAAGHALYQVTCITCHGANLEGVNNQGPCLIGDGSASVYFQVTTGRMPLAQQGAYSPRKVARFTNAQAEQLAAFIEHEGGGPAIPMGSLRGSSSTIASGGELFRLNCASCHGTTFKGAPLSAGKQVPSLNDATDKQIYAAMLSGPESMPVFSNNQITPAEKKSIITYVQTLKASNDPGGSGIDRIGPVSEAIVIWVAGVGGLMLAILWIGARSR